MLLNVVLDFIEPSGASLPLREVKRLDERLLAGRRSSEAIGQPAEAVLTRVEDDAGPVPEPLRGGASR